MYGSGLKVQLNVVGCLWVQGEAEEVSWGLILLDLYEVAFIPQAMMRQRGFRSS